ncbi:MAG: hypothetical protein JSR17_00585 [Proteobacteria bacterium]|nr:hypothetical protein [Pseudomonadota bacterium]
MVKSLPPASVINSVTVTTWGTSLDGGNGMAHYLESNLLGGNVGHASITVTFLADEAGRKLVEKYCLQDPPIPFQRVLQTGYDANGNVVKNEVYQVYFSWWPKEKTDKGERSEFALSENVNEDSDAERAGVDVGAMEPSIQTELGLEQEERNAYGRVGARKMKLGVHEIRHENRGDLSEQQKSILKKQSKLHALQRNIEVLELIKKKLKEKFGEDRIKLDVTLIKLLNKAFPDWKEAIGKNKEEHVEELSEREAFSLKDKVERQIEESDNKSHEQETELEKMRGELNAEKPSKEDLSRSQDLDVFMREHKADPDIYSKAKKEGFTEKECLAHRLKMIDKDMDILKNIKEYLQANVTIDSQEVAQRVYKRLTHETWKPYLPPEYQKMTIEQMLEQWHEIRIEILSYVKQQSDELENLKNKERALSTLTSDFAKGNNEEFVTRGRPPGNIIELPVASLTEQDERENAEKGKDARLGLNIERMLQKMREIATEGSQFDLVVRNCSYTTGGILAAGASKEHQVYFKQKAWGGFGNPQEVLNGAMQYQDSLILRKGKKSTAEQISRFNPLNAVTWAGGKLLRNTQDPSTSLATKVASGIGLVPVALVAGAGQTIKGIVTPKNTFNKSVKFINYARKNDSILLKVLIAPVAVVTALTAVPAVIQMGVEGAAKTQKVIKKENPKEISPSDEPRQQVTVTENPLWLQPPITTAYTESLNNHSLPKARSSEGKTQEDKAHEKSKVSGP